MFKSLELYIDLGTANTIVFSKKHGFLLNEPSFLVIRKRAFSRSEMFALGKPAKLMLGKTPEKLSVLRPLRAGVIADFEGVSKMLAAFVNRIKCGLVWINPKLIISLPCRVTQFEERAVEEVGRALGAKKVHLLDEPVAAAIGAGLPILGNSAQGIVDIGGGTSEVAIMSMGGIIVSRAVRTGGDNIDDAIVDLLRSHHGFLIGPATAERIKIATGNAMPDGPLADIDIGGIDLVSGLPRKMTVTSGIVFPAVDSVVKQIIAAVRSTLEECPPEVSSDIYQNGIVIAGGGSLLRGIVDRLTLELGIPVRLASDPLMSVALGGAKTLESPKLLDLVEKR